MLNSSQCSCILTDTCLANRPRPCANNGTCVLGSSPDKYTCDCTGTGFMQELTVQVITKKLIV